LASLGCASLRAPAALATRRDESRCCEDKFFGDLLDL
jgi:hypothetical protein